MDDNGPCYRAFAFRYGTPLAGHHGWNHVAALGIPEVMGYTNTIGTPVITGLYTLLLPVLVFALFGSSRHLVVSADSATAAMVAAGLASQLTTLARRSISR